MPRIFKTGFFALLVFFILFGALCLLGLNRVSHKYDRFIYADISHLPETRVALVLGAGLKSDGTPSDALADRVETAVKLYQAGKIEKLLMTGDNGSRYYDEVTAMKNLARELGVPEEGIVLDYAGFRTYDSCYRAHDIFSLKEAIIVTQGFHLPRALYTCNEMGIKSVGVIADQQAYLNSNWWRTREIAAQIVAWWQVNLLHPQPKFLGEKVEF